MESSSVLTRCDFQIASKIKPGPSEGGPPPSLKRPIGIDPAAAGETSCKIQMHPLQMAPDAAGNAERQCTLSGMPSSIAAAKNAITVRE